MPTLKEELLAPTTGILVLKHFNDGDSVHAGDEVATIESMKMMFPLTAGIDGVIQYYHREQELVHMDAVIAAITHIS